jgi:hypothetical protein
MATEKDGSPRSGKRAAWTTSSKVDTASDASAPSAIKSANGKERAEKAFEAMCTPLQSKCGAIRELLAESGRNDAKAQFKLGALVNDAKADVEKYGHRGVAQLAAALGYNVATLYRVAKVNERWSWSELSAILNKRSPTGLPLGFTHLVVIAAVPAKRDRDVLIEVTLAEGLSVRALRRQVERASNSGEEQPGERVTHHPATVRYLIARSEAALEEMKRWDAVLDALEKQAITPKLAAATEVALGHQKELVGQMNRVMARLDAWRTRTLPESRDCVQIGSISTAPDSLTQEEGSRGGQRAVA